jgi:hypothetical protein
MAIVTFQSDTLNNEPAPLGVFDPGSIVRFNPQASEFPYTTYSGADILATMTMPDGEMMVLGGLQTISYSIHRENTPVRLIGRAGPVSFVKGSRMIAGSMIFTVFNQYAFYRLSCMEDRIKNGKYGLADMLPPFDITLSFNNEYGSQSKMRIYGISIVDEGGTMSIDDLITEQTMTYIARGIQPLSPYTNVLRAESMGESANDVDTKRYSVHVVS